MSIKNKFLFAVVFFLSIDISAKEAQVCDVKAQGDAAKFFCSAGESEVVLEEASGQSIKFAQSYVLVLNKALFADKRNLFIIDKASKQQRLALSVTKSGHAIIKTMGPGAAWVLKGLSNLGLKSLVIESDDTIVLADVIDVERKLDIRAKNLYMPYAFSVHKGSVKLTFKKSVIARINFTFKSSLENNWSIIESFSQIDTPSKRRIALTAVPQLRAPIAPDDFSKAYKKIIKKNLADAYPKYTSKKTNLEKQSYITRYVLPNTAHNKKVRTKNLNLPNMWSWHTQKTYA